MNRRINRIFSFLMAFALTFTSLVASPVSAYLTANENAVEVEALGYEEYGHEGYEDEAHEGEYEDYEDETHEDEYEDYEELRHAVAK